MALDVVTIVVVRMARAAPASIGVIPRIFLEVVELGSCGRTHSGMGSRTLVSPASLSAVCMGGEVVPLEDVEVEGNAGGVSAAGSLAGLRCSAPRVASPLRFGCRRAPGRGPG